MNQTPYGQYQNHPPQADVLKKSLLPGIIVSSVGALIAIIGCALPFISMNYGSQSETESIFSLAFGGGRTIAGILIIVSVMLVFLPTLSAYFRPMPGQIRIAGFTSIGGGILGVITVLLIMFVFPQEGGGTVSETLDEINAQGSAYGIEAGFSVGMYVTMAAFIIGTVGGVLYLLKAIPYDKALIAEQHAAMQNAPMGGYGQPGGQQPGGQPYGQQQGGQPYGQQPGGQQFGQQGQAPYQQGGLAPHDQGGQPYGQPGGPAPHEQGQAPYEQQPPQQSGNAWQASSAPSAPEANQPPQGPPSPNHPHNPNPNA